MSREQAVSVQPIATGDIAKVAEFLSTHLNSRVSPQIWAQGIATAWLPPPPNHGFMLVADGDLVGVNLAFYSVRKEAGRLESFCNLGALCVLPEWRAHSIRLMRKVLSQKGHTFTDFSPSGPVIEVNRRLGFVDIDTATRLHVNVPWPLPPRVQITTDEAAIRLKLKPPDLELFHDHAGSPAAHHIVVSQGSDYCYVIVRRDRRKRIPLFASVLYISNEQQFERHARTILSAILTRTGALATLVEVRVSGHRSPMSFALGSARPKMIRSTSVTVDEVDYLYSELTQITW